MIRALYSLLMWLAQPLLVRKLRSRAVAEPGYGHAIEQRFGDYRNAAGGYAGADAAARTGPSAHTDPGGWVWVHAVSLGEARAAAVLVQHLRTAVPGMRLLLTHGTATGWEQGRALLVPGDVQVWQPWDTAGAVGRFLAHFKPRIGLLMETEVWPNLVHGCHRAGVPLCLVNARLSAKSLHKAQRLAWLSRPAFAALAAVWAQTEEDATRLRQLGAPVQAVLGNLKFDAAPNARQLELGRAWRAASGRPVVMFASSREGEEQLWLDALQRALPAPHAGAEANAPDDTPATAPDGSPAAAQPAVPVQPRLHVQWLIVPRHPQRFDAVAALLANAGLRVSRRSTWQGAPDAASVDVWLGDSLGEMALYFGLADVALLGGSFAPLGGQNLIEAAACGCPVVMGPHTFNFAEAADMARTAGAAFEVSTLAAALDRVDALLQSDTELAGARAAALQWSQHHRGAAAKTVAAVVALLQGRT